MALFPTLNSINVYRVTLAFFMLIVPGVVFVATGQSLAGIYICLLVLLSLIIRYKHFRPDKSSILLMCSIISFHIPLVDCDGMSMYLMTLQHFHLVPSLSSCH